MAALKKLRHKESQVQGQPGQFKKYGVKCNEIFAKVSTQFQGIHKVHFSNIISIINSLDRGPIPSTHVVAYNHM